MRWAERPRRAPGVPARPLLVGVLGSLSAFGPLSIDMYLPALPAMADDLHAAPSLVQLTLTACLLGLAAGQLVGGPISDARGRRGPLLAGLAVYVVASALCALAPSVGVLIALRFVQGAAGSFGIVIGRAVVRDLHEGREAARLFAALILVNGVAPILAPVIGAGILHVTSWRGVFAVLAVIGAGLLVVVAAVLGETLPAADRHAGGLRATLRTFRELLGDRGFVGCVLSAGLAFAAMFAYISGSPFVLQDVYGASPAVFAVLFGINGLGIVLAGRLSSRLSERYDPAALLGAGLSATATGGVGLLLAILTGVGLAGVLPALLVTVASIGIIVPNAAALALGGHRSRAGSASGLLGLAQFALGAFAAPLVGLAGKGTAVPMGIVIAVLGVAALATFVLLVARGTAGRTTDARAAP
ncbi:MAG: drug resistance transporter, Bcr/CflA subfamily [Conexibacter sp.]|nr:drug resistance transporter, Bcr/CflA subfamily [Conexibacter sp.]